MNIKQAWFNLAVWKASRHGIEKRAPTNVMKACKQIIAHNLSVQI